MRTRASVATTLLLCGRVFAAADDLEVFEKRVRPVLATKCYSCHGPDKQFAALRLDSREAVLRGGQSGPAAVAGKADESLLIKAVRHAGPKMPLGEKLKDSEIAALEDWVTRGLPWPAAKEQQTASTPAFYGKLLREHWAFQPVRATARPQSAGRNAIDGFIQARLTERGLKPAARAERHVLARRAAYVLTGLPPDAKDLHRFLDDSSPAAYEKYVDRLLASPHFGEQWARHWMDVVRYAETYGYEWNYEIHGAWRYRDYLIRAFNSDLPFDQFILEHVAGDLLKRPRLSPDGSQNESILGTTFFRLGEMGHDDCFQFREIRTDVVDNQIDTLTKAFQGLTVSCARCHDHKIDPIPTEDYYALYGILNSSRPVTRTLDLNGPSASAQDRLEQRKNAVRQLLAAAWLNETNNLGRQLQAALTWNQDGKDSVELASGIDPIRVNLLLKLLKRDKLDLDDPLYPIAKLALSSNWTQTWSELTKQYQTESETRAKYNREKFTPLADFRETLPAGWSADGLGLRSGRATSGDFAVSTEGSDAVAGIYPSGIYSNLISDRLNGVLRSPLLPGDKKFLSLRVVGSRVGAERTIVDDCVIGEDHKLIDSAAMTWITVPTKANQNLPVYVELATKADNPRFPERPGKFGPRDDDPKTSRSYFGVQSAVLHDENVTPKAEITHVQRLLSGAAPVGIAELASRFQSAAQAAITAWRDERATDDDVAWLNWLTAQLLVTNSRNVTPELRAATDAYRQEETSLANPTVIFAMGDFDPGSDNPIFLGGRAQSPGKLAPRHFLSLMPAELRSVDQTSSGRRELAAAIASPKNPLTARVMVNRIWQYVFGRGLVATPDDFGRYGERPTDPELLDYLAARFMEDGWSVKKMVRLMVLSATFQQSSTPDATTKEHDPANALWTRYPVRRLEGENIRDTILAVSGRLDPRLYGPSIQPHRDQPTDYRRLFQGPLDGEGRRSIYIKVTRMEGPRFLELFDMPPPLQTRGRRDVTNVPSQSLALLNDPFVLQEADVWAAKLVGRKDDTTDARLNAMFDAAFGRPLASDEAQVWRELVSRLAAQHQVGAADVLASKTVWRDVAHTVFNTKEFLYLR